MQKKREERRNKRDARKELNQVSPDQFSYPKARECNTTTTPIPDREIDWKNTDDCGKGITHFLWKEEFATYRAEIRENEIKYWNALNYPSKQP